MLREIACFCFRPVLSAAVLLLIKSNFSSALINDVRRRAMPKLIVSLGMISIAGIRLYVHESVLLILFVNHRVNKVVVNAVHFFFNQTVAIGFEAGEARVEVAHKLQVTHDNIIEALTWNK